jgi:cytochrome P450
MQNPSEWHEVDAKATVVEIIARLSSRVFLGPELCRNPEWLRITIDYTMTVFHGIMALKKWPSFLHRIVWRFVPEVRRVNEQIAEAVRLIRPVIDKKMAQGKILPDGSKPAHLDVIQWASEVADGRRYDPTLLQLGFSMASMHNTTDLVTQILYDLSAHPSYIDPLRAEIETVLTEEGMTKSALARLKLMDSFMKESQRIKPSESCT